MHSFLIDEETLPVLLGHIHVNVPFTLKVFSTHGAMVKNFLIAIETMNYVLETNHFTFLHADALVKGQEKVISPVC